MQIRFPKHAIGKEFPFSLFLSFKQLKKYKKQHNLIHYLAWHEWLYVFLCNKPDNLSNAKNAFCAQEKLVWLDARVHATGYINTLKHFLREILSMHTNLD